MQENFKIVEGEIVSIYENSKGERLVNARELFYALKGEKTKTKFIDWIKEKLNKYKFVENEDFISFSQKNEKPSGGRPNKEYYLTVDMAKELCMIENNEMGRKIRKYFIEVEKRYRTIIESPQNIFDVMHLALNQIEENEKRLSLVERESKQNKEEIEYKVIYEKNTKNGKKGEIKEKGYKIENICYKVKI